MESFEGFGLNPFYSGEQFRALCPFCVDMQKIFREKIKSNEAVLLYVENGSSAYLTDHIKCSYE